MTTLATPDGLLIAMGFVLLMLGGAQSSVNSTQ